MSTWHPQYNVNAVGTVSGILLFQASAAIILMDCSLPGHFRHSIVVPGLLFYATVLSVFTVLYKDVGTPWLCVSRKALPSWLPPVMRLSTDFISLIKTLVKPAQECPRGISYLTSAIHDAREYSIEELGCDALSRKQTCSRKKFHLVESEGIERPRAKGSQYLGICFAQIL